MNYLLLIFLLIQANNLKNSYHGIFYISQHLKYPVSYVNLGAQKLSASRRVNAHLNKKTKLQIPFMRSPNTQLTEFRSCTHLKIHHPVGQKRQKHTEDLQKLFDIFHCCFMKTSTITALGFIQERWGMLCGLQLRNVRRICTISPKTIIKCCITFHC